MIKVLRFATLILACLLLLSASSFGAAVARGGGDMSDDGSGGGYDIDNGFFGFNDPLNPWPSCSVGTPCNFWGATLTFTLVAPLPTGATLNNWIAIEFIQNLGTPPATPTVSNCAPTSLPTLVVGLNTITCAFAGLGLDAGDDGGNFNSWTNGSSSFYGAFIEVSGLSAGNPLKLDHSANTVSLTMLDSAPTPEPMSWMLGLSGLMAMAAVRILRQKKGQA